MGEFLTIYLGIMAAIAFGLMWFAYLCPAGWERLKAWNKRTDQKMKASFAARREEKKQTREASITSTAASPILSPRLSSARRFRHRWHRHDHHDPLLHGLIAGAAASSLRDDVEEAIIRETFDAGNEEDDRSGEW